MIKLKKFYSGITCILLAVVLTAGMLCFAENTVPSEQRKLIYTINVVDPSASFLATFKTAVDYLKNRGFTGISLSIPWNRIEAVKDVYNFSEFDPFLDYVVNSGLQLQIRINTGWVLPNWLSDDYKCYNRDGTLFEYTNYVGTCHIINYSSPQAIERVSLLYRMVAGYYQSRYRKHISNPNPIYCYSMSFSPCLESEYWSQSFIDYSNITVKAFQDWLLDNYGNISLLNSRWKTSYSAFSDIEIPYQGSTPAAMDLYDFREYALKNVIDILSETIHSVDDYAKIGVQHGSLYDSQSRGRGTYHADAWFENVDWIFIADAPGYPHAFAVDMLRTVAKGKKISNEIDGPEASGASNSAYLEQGTQSYNHGADAVYLTNWTKSAIEDSKWSFVDQLVEQSKQQAASITSSTAIYMSTAAMDANGNNYSLNAALAKYNELTNNGTASIDIFRDGSFIKDKSFLNKYTDIYVVGSTRIDDSARAALLSAEANLITENSQTGTLDKYGIVRNSLNNLSDSIKPYVFVGNMSDNMTITGNSFTIIGTSEDSGGSGIKKIEVSIDGGIIWNEAAGGPNWKYVWNNIENRPYIVYIRAVDNSNNYSDIIMLNINNSLLYNLAPAATVTADSVLAPYTPELAVDTIKNDTGRWVSGNSSEPHYIQLEFETEKSISNVKVWSGRSTGRGWQISDYTIDCWNGTQWQTVYSVVNNIKDGYNGEYNDLSFPAVITDKIRMYITDACNTVEMPNDTTARLMEIEVWGYEAAVTPLIISTGFIQSDFQLHDLNSLIIYNDFNFFATLNNRTNLDKSISMIIALYDGIKLQSVTVQKTVVTDNSLKQVDMKYSIPDNMTVTSLKGFVFENTEKLTPLALPALLN